MKKREHVRITINELEEKLAGRNVYNLILEISHQLKAHKSGERSHNRDVIRNALGLRVSLYEDGIDSRNETFTQFKERVEKEEYDSFLKDTIRPAIEKYGAKI